MPGFLLHHANEVSHSPLRHKPEDSHAVGLLDPREDHAILEALHIQSIQSAHMDPNSIRKMSQQERLQAMEALWDALMHEGVEPSSPSWHQEVLASRTAKIEEGKAQFLTLDELKAEK
jgi:putative addiction module component (TIGR02574 family)